MTSEHKTFRPDQMAELIDRAARHLVERCRSLYCDPAPPMTYLFVVTSQTASRAESIEHTFLDTHSAARYLVDEHGGFRSWINLSPIGIACESTVLELDYSNTFVQRLFIGDLALPFEPFHLLGPSLPAGWNEGDPVPKVDLPHLRSKSEE